MDFHVAYERIKFSNIVYFISLDFCLVRDRNASFNKFSLYIYIYVPTFDVKYAFCEKLSAARVNIIQFTRDEMISFLFVHIIGLIKTIIDNGHKCFCTFFKVELKLLILRKQCIHTITKHDFCRIIIWSLLNLKSE